MDEKELDELSFETTGIFKQIGIDKVLLYKDLQKFWYSDIPLIGEWLTAIRSINNVMYIDFNSNLFPRNKGSKLLKQLEGEYKIKLVVERVKPCEEFKRVEIKPFNEGVLLGENELEKNESSELVENGS